MAARAGILPMLMIAGGTVKGLKNVGYEIINLGAVIIPNPLTILRLYSIGSKA